MDAGFFSIYPVDSRCTKKTGDYPFRFYDYENVIKRIRADQLIRDQYKMGAEIASNTRILTGRYRFARGKNCSTH
jgi:uncharacterized protein YaiL (DUF2058 family)